MLNKASEMHEGHRDADDFKERRPSSSPAFPSLQKPLCVEPKVDWIADIFVILVPFTLVWSISKLGFSTLVADLNNIVGLVYLYVFDIKELVVNKGSPAPLTALHQQEL